MTQDQELGDFFIKYASGILAATTSGLTGVEILKQTRRYALDFNVIIPHPIYPFEAPNKRTALMENLLAFSQQQRYQIIIDLCDYPSGRHESLKTSNR